MVKIPIERVLAVSFTLGMAGCVAPTTPVTATLPRRAAVEGPWQVGPIATFQIFKFKELADFESKLQSVEVVTLELDEVEGAGGRALTDVARKRGTRVICYLSLGYEDFRADATSYPTTAIGDRIGDWPGEKWGNPTDPALLGFIGKRFDRAKAAGCDGVELDNMDVAWNKTGFTITPQQNVDAVKQLAADAKARDLRFFAKNGAEMAGQLATAVDGIFIESCQKEKECDLYLPYRGKLVAMTEYASCRPIPWAPVNCQRDYFDDKPDRR